MNIVSLLRCRVSNQELVFRQGSRHSIHSLARYFVVGRPVYLQIEHSSI